MKYGKIRTRPKKKKKKSSYYFRTRGRIRGKFAFSLFLVCSFVYECISAQVGWEDGTGGTGGGDRRGSWSETADNPSAGFQQEMCGNPQPPLSSYRLAENTESLPLFPLITSSSHRVLSCFKGGKDVSTSNRRLPQNPNTRNLYGLTGKQAFFCLLARPIFLYQNRLPTRVWPFSRNSDDWRLPRDTRRVLYLNFFPLRFKMDIKSTTNDPRIALMKSCGKSAHHNVRPKSHLPSSLQQRFSYVLFKQIEKCNPAGKHVFYSKFHMTRIFKSLELPFRTSVKFSLCHLQRKPPQCCRNQRVTLRLCNIYVCHHLLVTTFSQLQRAQAWFKHHFCGCSRAKTSLSVHLQLNAKWL